MKHRMTYANVVATLALCVALSGTAWAAANIGSADVVDNSLKSRDIMNGTLASHDLAPGAVTSSRIADGAITSADLSGDVTNAIIGTGRATAWATVDFSAGPAYTPQLVGTLTSNIESVRRSVSPGSYCLVPASGLSFANRPALAVADYGRSGGDQFHVYIDSTASECSPGELAVITNTDTGAGRSVVAFSVIVF